ncbi:HAD-IA family hydrolase [Staphylococcus sp. SQ8-PEA]|uniref:HAD-IA family hydrolase n=1 Tax=Staphylococcus marylandisciuri TaxID=2981529 RepID=A0ABT2QMM8_9STAP|nr:HAD-IA family hydrolase [Staphylococcus marylandisciuri]MCU5745226.1 HAD-IA family hydrolase [Staphylococcus marylandisciuri]
MYRAVIFDFDGTIIDTEQHIYETINHYLEEQDEALISRSYYSETIGGSDDQLRSYLAETIGEEEQTRLYEDIHRSSASLPIRPEIKEIMTMLKQRHIPMAVATSSYRKDIEEAYNHLELGDFIDVVVGKEDVEEVKPSPELYLRAVQALNYNPVNCLAIEDSLNGAESATTAGLDVVINTNNLTKHHDFSSINYTDKDITAEQLIERYFDRGEK